MGKRGPKARGYIRPVDKNNPDGRCELWFGREYCGVYPSRGDAEEVRNNTYKQLSPGQKLAGRYGDEWIASLEAPADQRGAHDYWVKQRGMWNRHMRTAAWYSMPPKEVGTKHAQQWVNHLAETRAVQTKWVRSQEGKKLTAVETKRLLSASRFRDVLGLARMFFDHLITTNVIAGMKSGKAVAGNPFRLVTMPTRIARASKEAKEDEDHDDDGDDWSEDYGDDEDDAMLIDQHIVHLTPEEIDRLFLQTLEPHIRCAWAIAIYCGLRKSEILSLKWRDLRLWGERPEVQVRRGYGTGSKKKKLKSKRARREVPLFPWAITAIVAYRDSLKHPPKLGDYVFLRSNTRFAGRHPRSPERFAKSYDFGWRTNTRHLTPRARAGIRDEVKFHALRHTCGCHLLQGTWTKRPLPIQLVSKWLGHASIAVTERHYATLISRNLHDALEEDRRGWAAGDSEDLHAAIAA